MQMSGQRSRQAAMEVIRRVLEQGAYANLVLGPELDRYQVQGPDRALSTTLVHTALRQRSFLIAALESVSREGRFPPALEPILLLGAVQLLLLDRIPDHAALDTTVELVKSRRMGRYTALVNGLLRSMQRQREQLLAARQAPDAPLEWLGPVPLWLAERWVNRMGETAARELLKKMGEPAQVDLRVMDTDRAEYWAQQLEAEPIPGEPIRLSLPGGNPAQLPGFDEGAWVVQDRNAARVLQQLPPGGQRVLDLCAAPGGKTTQLAKQQKDAELIAVELHGHRADLVRQALARCGLKGEVLAGDARELGPKLGQFDRIVLDAPCTGLGTLRRHPEIASRRNPKSSKKAQRLQKELLEVATTALLPGGFLIYAVCSLEPEEGEQVIQSLLARHEELSLCPTADFAEGQGWLGLDGDGDGFFLALLEKRS